MKKLLLLLILLICLTGCNKTVDDIKEDITGVFNKEEPVEDNIIEIDFNNTITERSNNSNEPIDITTKNYYEAHVINDANMEELESKSSQYMIYFHQHGCATCAQTNIYIDEYVRRGLCNSVQMYFAMYNEETTTELFDKYSEVDETPMLIFVNGEERTVADGYEEITEVMNNILNNNNE